MCLEYFGVVWYISMVYIKRGALMSTSGIAKLFKSGRSQAVRLPKEFRMPGDRVRVRRDGKKVVLEPMPTDVKAWWAELDRFGAFDIERDQPPMPPPKVLFK